MRLLRAPCPRLIACGNLACQWNYIFSEEIAYIDLSQKDPICTCMNSVCDTQKHRNQLWHTKGNNCTVRKERKKKKEKQCSLNADCNNLHFFFTKLCDVIKRSCYRFFIPPSVQQAENVFSLYLTLMWQTVCFVISAKDIKCLFWYKLGGVRLAGRMGEWEADVKGREMSIYESVYQNKLFTLDKL